jgi:hypothetical protein
MRIILIVLAAIFFTSCGDQSAISKKLSGCDSLVITFNVPNGDSVLNRVSTTETKAIKKLSAFLSGKQFEKDSCGFDGNMNFFKAGESVLPVVFQFNEKGCRYFMYGLDGKTVRATMSNEAADFLKSLVGERGLY